MSGSFLRFSYLRHRSTVNRGKHSYLVRGGAQKTAADSYDLPLPRTPTAQQRRVVVGRKCRWLPSEWHRTLRPHNQTTRGVQLPEFRWARLSRRERPRRPREKSATQTVRRTPLRKGVARSRRQTAEPARRRLQMSPARALPLQWPQRWLSCTAHAALRRPGRRRTTGVPAASSVGLFR